MDESEAAITNWIESVSGRDWIWHAKYIAANDTYAKPNVHQGGPYLAKDILRTAFPILTSRAESEKNPDLILPVHVASHQLSQDVRLIWYNTRRLEQRSNGRDEARLTNWGGRHHPLVEENATGSLVVFAFHQSDFDKNADHCEVWICQSPQEEDVILEIVGPVDPGAGIFFAPSRFAATYPSIGDSPCALRDDEMRSEWIHALPSGEEILAMVLGRRPKARKLQVDERLMKRRDCEFELFRSIESHVVLPRVREGFRTVEEFVSFANEVTNRRKSRAGKSLELQAKTIFDEEALRYSWGKKTEDKRTPDFIFPSIEHYHDAKWPHEKLRMLAAKTTCKDRWRQVLNEASRIPSKHLLTLQEGVSVQQFKEMTDEGVTLVVPSSLQQKFPDAVKPQLISLKSFIAESRFI